MACFIQQDFDERHEIVREGGSSNASSYLPIPSKTICILSFVD
jgi:hypothetical protein